MERATWNDRFFSSLPLPPFAVAALAAALLVGLFLALVAVTGELAAFQARGAVWWRDRDARLAVMLALLAAYLPAARRHHALETQRNLERLGAGGAGEAASGARAGAVALALVPLTALLVDRGPIFLRGEYWGPAQLWTWGVGGFACWHGGRLVQAIVSQGRRFAELARRLTEIDLLALERLDAFSRQGLQSALPGLVVLSFFAFNLVDQGFAVAVALFAPLAAAFAAAGLLLPVRPLQRRIAAARSAELRRVSASVRGEPGALAGTLLAQRSEPVGLADLLAYRSFLEALPSWPIAAPVRLRLLLYGALPLGSWLGGALVERLLSQALD